MNHKRIVYMGTPDFAVLPLQKLLEGGYDIVGVVTATDKEAGRGRNITQSAVKKYACQQGLKVLQPEKLGSEDFLKELKELRPDIIVVVAFRMLPESVWSMPTIGTFNLHASLLPRYRGAAPINRAIMNGDTYSGVTTFMLDKHMDTGEIIMSERVEITPDDCAGTLHDKLMETGAELVVKTVDMMESGELKTRKQEEIDDPTKAAAPKIFKETCLIDWNKDCEQINNLVRGLSPYPAAWSPLNDMAGVGTTFKIFKVKPIIEKHNHPVGTILSDLKKRLLVAVGDGFIEIEELQQSGKKRVRTEEYLRGAHIEDKIVKI